MSHPLVHQLRISGAPWRKRIATELAERGDEFVVNELIRMAEGRRRTYLRFYDLDDQLTAIEALSQTKSERALCFLRNLRHSNATSLTMFYHFQGGDIISEYYVETIEFPNARRALRKSLKFTNIYAESDSWQLFTEEEHAEIQSRFSSKTERERIRVPRDPNDSYRSIVAAIQNLEESLKAIGQEDIDPD